jgi:sugar phosphate isomerase/epimerase
MKKFLISTATLPMAVGKNFYDYEGIPEAYYELDIDGAELVFLPEWDNKHAPLTPTSADWNVTPKINVSELVNLCIINEIQVYSVHINRDVGNMLSSWERKVVLEGQNILKSNLSGASELRVKVAVFHMWNTYDDHIDLKLLFKRMYEVSRDYEINIAVENIPLSDKNMNSTKAWKILSDIMPEEYGFTLDLNWSSLYDNFEELKKFSERILNVHVQGFLSIENGDYSISPRVGKLDMLKSLNELCSDGYENYITLEMNKPKGLDDFRQAVKMIKKASGRYRQK